MLVINMKIILVISCFSFCLLGIAQDQNVNKITHILRPITWNSNRPLKWIDFRGKPDDEKPAAHTFTELNLVTTKDENGLITFYVTALFYPEKSYVNKKALSNNYILNHEQMHFNIAEIYAREIRRLLEPWQNTIDTSKIDLVDVMYEKLYQKFTEEQNLYDEETSHSVNLENQNKWNKSIMSHLASLSTYEEAMYARNVVGFK
jgi:hypothetical protein